MKEIDDNFLLCEKHITTNTQAIKQLVKKLGEIDKSVSSIKMDIAFMNSDLKQKMYNVQQRWKIISDERITSIPSTEEEWYEASQIVSQPSIKTWKPKNLSQSKTSMFNTSNDEPNQDFSQFNDEDFEKIIDEQEIPSTPKPKKKSKPRTMTL